MFRPQINRDIIVIGQDLKYCLIYFIKRLNYHLFTDRYETIISTKTSCH